MILFVFFFFFNQDINNLKIVDKRFEAIIKSETFDVFQTVKAVKLENGNIAFISIGSCLLTNPKAQELINAEKVCQVNAIKNAVGFTNNIQISSQKQIMEKTVVIIENEKQDIKNVSNLLEITEEKIKGAIQGMGKIASFSSKKSQDGSYNYYIVMGKIVNKKGDVIFLEISE
jgi:hypothetical protein